MNSLDDASYRLQLARGYLAKAEHDARDGRWDDCLANAQEVVENAGKLIQPREAQAGLEKARRAVALAEAVYSEMSGNP